MNVNIHVDCDPLWVYASEYGTTVGADDASIYEESLPALAAMLEKRKLHATFFVIGRDLELPACREFCREMLRRGHAIGNHSYSHSQKVHTLSADERRLEVVKCHDAVRQTLGYDCTGLRMPGYYFDRRIADVIHGLGYTYDSSVLPGLAIYMMAAFYLLLNSKGKDKRFGRSWYLFARHSPYRLRAGAGGQPLWEVPIAVCPFLLLPIHSTFVFQSGLGYLWLALRLARLRRQRHLAYLFHAIDLLPSDRTGPLARSVAVLRRPVENRRAIVETALDWLAQQPVTLTEKSVGLPDA